MRGALTDGFAAGVFSPAGVSTVADSSGAGASTGADSADAEASTGADSVGDGASDEPVTISFNSNAFARFPSARNFPTLVSFENVKAALRECKQISS